MIYRLTKLGRFLGYGVWIGKREQQKDIFNGEKFSELSLNEFPIKNLEKIKEDKIKQIDVIWFDKEKPIYAFEVEETTPIISAVDRFSYLLDIFPEMANKLIIVSPERRKRKLNKELRTSRFIGHPLYMETKVKYIFYEILRNEYERIRKNKEKVNIEFLNGIASSPEIEVKF